MILLQVFLIALNAVFACAEIAVISMSDSKLAKLAAEGDKRAVRLARLTSQPARFSATIQVAITLSGFLGSAFAAENFSDGLVAWVTGLGVTVPAATLDALGVIPQDISTVEVETAGLVIKVTDIREHRVKTTLVCLENTAASETGE